MIKKITNFSLKALVSLGFLAWIIFKVDWQEVFGLLRKIEIQYIFIYFIILALGILISAYKWKFLADFKGIKLPLADFFKLYLTGTFVNNFMPSFIGGDTYRAYQIGKKDKKYSEAASSVVMDRLTGLFGAMVLSLIFSLINFNVINKNHILLMLNLIIAGCVLLVIIFFVTRWMSFWKKIAKHNSKISQYIPEKILHFIAELAHYQSEANILWRATAWACVFGIVGIATTNYVIFLALGAKVNIINYLSVIFLISFVSSIPISINNIGIKEWAYVTFFGLFGVSSAVVITVAILSRFLQMLLSFLAFPIYLRNKQK
jgi:uncharacterized protein (TIRG00374 family)